MVEWFVTINGVGSGLCESDEVTIIFWQRYYTNYTFLLYRWQFTLLLGNGRRMLDNSRNLERIQKKNIWDD